MTRKERILVVLFSVGITALILIGIWSLRVPEAPAALPPPEPVIDEPSGEGTQPDTRPEDVEEPPAAKVPTEWIPMEPDPEGGSIEGKVTEETTAPLQNATVTVMQNGQPLKYAFTDEDGKYIIETLKPGNYSVRADREGYAVATRGNVEVIRLQTTPNVDFDLAVGCMFSGTVVDGGADEAPVAGANVTLYATEPVGPSGGVVRTFRAKTDMKGKFEIQSIPPGEFRALAQHEAYIPSERINLTVNSSEPTVHEFVLELGGSVSGTVTDMEDNPVKDAQVWLSSAEGSIVFSRGARTDADGKYVLMGLEKGIANVRVIAPDFITSTEEDIVIFKGRATEGVDFRLDRGNSISGVVVNALGEPVGNATISGNDTKSYKTARSDEEGAFTLSGFAGDEVSVSVRAEGYVLLTKRNIPVNTADLRLVLSTGGSVEGQAVSDVPMKSFVVVVYSIPDAGQQRRIVRQKISNDLEGRFRVDDIPEGTYTVEVHSKDYIQVKPETVEVRNNATVSGLQMPMRAR